MWWLLLLSALGCAAQTPIVEGTHFPPTQPITIAVIGDPPEAVQAAVTLLKQRGHRVVERTHLQAALHEQQFRLMHTPDAEADTLKIGKMMGAEQIIVIHATVTPEIVGSAVDGTGHIRTRYHLSATAKGIDISDGQVLWSGRARYSRSVREPQEGMLNLLTLAMFGTSYGNGR